ncbi:MAG: cob(I)yrinic acid a,c-diamide adenosyltransferase [Syntrophales bacterium]
MMGDKNRILIFTGEGKGKTTSALGMALRAHGHGIAVAVIQFVKTNTETGEYAALKKMENVEIITIGAGFVPRPADPRFADHCRAAKQGLQQAAAYLQTGRFGLVILDEVCVAVSLHLLDEEAVLATLRLAAPGTTIVLTGRGASPGLIEIADTVSEIKAIKHGYESGIKAQRGVEF